MSVLNRNVSWSATMGISSDENCPTSLFGSDCDEGLSIPQGLPWTVAAEEELESQQDEACPFLCPDRSLWAGKGDLRLARLVSWDEVGEEGSPMPCHFSLMALLKRFHNFS